MPIPPLNLVLEMLISIVLPGLVVSAIVGLLFLRWKLAGVAVLSGFITANVRDHALPWLEWDRELGRILLTMILSLATMALSGSNKAWQCVSGMAW